ncbi:Uncharacterised protein [Mycobacterium tuberculosis]|uniref:Uncharacterized protein n=1 Tax=Mycobacterium tuberculosis TaxID=1773 RepID=A0A0U0TE80_MYCTX|nr:Uncharacterised protein [Mycobacterium tuberculosis]COW59834.1 Uncharacterised protein [Mycobacterium tuberculosis]COX20297.1 Uncharacterised protein [Mycobacterium tuberculosis]COX47499.1 Uncharacterised protein [Mycobacterium tuberculosis]COY41163.1 Uncharacterised protein [Mycobacterium tuberculosis]
MANATSEAPNSAASRSRNACGTSTARNRGAGSSSSTNSIRSSPERSRPSTASPSPARIASAKVPITLPNRCDVRSCATSASSRTEKPSTKSASTAPASTDANWSASPTRINRAPGRTASASRAISVSDTIEVSSTTITL